MMKKTVRGIVYHDGKCELKELNENDECFIRYEFAERYNLTDATIENIKKIIQKESLKLPKPDDWIKNVKGEATKPVDDERVFLQQDHFYNLQEKYKDELELMTDTVNYHLEKFNFKLNRKASNNVAVCRVLIQKILENKLGKEDIEKYKSNFFTDLEQKSSYLHS